MRDRTNVLAGVANLSELTGALAGMLPDVLAKAGKGTHGTKVVLHFVPTAAGWLAKIELPPVVEQVVLRRETL